MALALMPIKYPNLSSSTVSSGDKTEFIAPRTKQSVLINQAHEHNVSTSPLKASPRSPRTTRSGSSGPFLDKQLNKCSYFQDIKSAGPDPKAELCGKLFISIQYLIASVFS